VVQLGSLVMRYAAEGYQEVIRADRQVRDNVSKTARHAQRDEAKTKGWLQRHKTALLAITGAISGAMYTIAKNSPSMSAAIGEIRLAFSLFLMDIGERLSPLLDDWSEFVWKLEEGWEKIPDDMKDAMITPLNTAHEKTQKSLWKILTEWTKFTTNLKKRFGDIKTLMKNIPTAAIEEPTEFLGGAPFKLGGKIFGDIFLPFKLVEMTWSWGKDLIDGITKGVDENKPSLMTTIKTLFSSITTKITAWLPGTIQWGGLLVGGLTEGVDGNKTTFTGSIGDIIDTVTSKVTGWVSGAKDWGSNLISRITEGVDSQEPSLLTRISGVIASVTDKFGEIASGAVQWGKDLITGITDGINTDEPSLLSRIDGLVGTITTKITGGISGAVQWGADLITGISDGAGTTEISLVDRITSTISNVTGKITEWLGGAKDWGMNLITGIVGGVRDKEETLYTNVTGVQTKVTRQFLDWIPNARKWGSDLMSNFIGGISSMFGALSSTLNSARRMVESALSFDIAANDRMAYRWGTDLVRYFEAGMRSAQFAVPMPIMAPVSPVGVSGGGGGALGSHGGGDVYITIEAGAVQVRGADAKTFDERALSRLIRDEIGQALRERSR